jgi:hypothetical protein
MDCSKKVWKNNIEVAGYIFFNLNKREEGTDFLIKMKGSRYSCV